jgi:phosphoglucosamine mutase
MAKTAKKIMKLNLLPKEDRKLFGTDGIRGEAGVYPFDADTLRLLGLSFAKLIKDNREMSKERNRSPFPIVAIGRDTRSSGPAIEESLYSALIESGVSVVCTGVIPTPALAHLTRFWHYDAGIMISASHNPAKDNGLKFFGSDGFKLADELEARIEELVKSKIRKDVVSTRGTLDRMWDDADYHGPAGIVISSRASESYAQFLRSGLGNISLDRMKIVLDAANGAAFYLGPLLFRSLKADVALIGGLPDGKNINAGFGSLHPDKISEYVKEKRCDLGIALDGDADRVIMCDENGNILDGDQLLAIIALDLQEQKKLEKSCVVGTQMTNSGFAAAMEKNGIKTVRTQVGDKYVVDCMRKNGYSLGGESSGHIICGDRSTGADGLCTALAILSIMQRKKAKLSELAGTMHVYPQVLINVPVKSKPELYSIPGMSDLVGGIESALGSSGRVLLRYSGTEDKARVMVEAAREELARNYAERIAGELSKRIGI